MAKKWYEYSVDDILKKRRALFLFEDITSKSAKTIVSDMLVMEEANSKEPIWLYINSPGGTVVDGLSIIDTIGFIKPKVNTVIVGEACSMAGIIFLFGHRRYVTLNSVFMAHPLSSMVVDYLEYMKDRFSYILELENKMNKIIKNKTKLTKKEIEKLKNGELWLTAEQCVKRGIAHKII